MTQFQEAHKGLPQFRLVVLTNGSIVLQKASDYQRPAIFERFTVNEHVDLFGADHQGQHVAGLRTGVIVSSIVTYHPLDASLTHWWERKYVVRINGSSKKVTIWESVLLAYNPRPLPMTVLAGLGVPSGAPEADKVQG